MHLFTTFSLSLFLTIGLVPVFKRMAFRMHLVDEPDERKVHVLPMPRSGGISMALGSILPVLIWAPMDSMAKALLLGCAIIVVFGVLDDVRNLKYIHKLAAQVAGALLFMVYGGVRISSLGEMLPGGMELPFVFSVILTLLFIVGVTNAINLADGLDGLAGGFSMLSFVTIGFFAFRCENTTIAVMAFSVAGAILGFLRYNTHPAVVFMGDAGSQMLGFLCAVFTLALTQANTPYSQITPLFLIGFPLLDTLTVMMERIASGRSPFKPDKNHFHHRLMKLGLYHSEAVFTIYLLQAIFISFAFIFRFYSNWTNLGIFLGLAFVIILFFYIARETGFKFRHGVEEERNAPKSVLAFVAGDRFSIKFFFRALKWGLTGIMILQAIIPGQVPWYMSIGAACLFFIILGVRFIKPSARNAVFRTTVYCAIPFLLWESTMTVPASWVTDAFLVFNNGVFIALVLCTVAVLNLTKRTKGFKFNPQDLLVFIVIIVLPNLPNIHLEYPGIKIVVVKAMMLFFSYDVLMGELREENKFMDISLSVIFAFIATRGII